MIYKSHLDLVLDDVFVEEHTILPHANLYMKIEGLSIGGSIKIKPALKMISRLEIQGKLKPGSKIIESSSGNLGIALSIICAAKGYEFNCVVDPNILPSSERLIKSYGANIIKVTHKDENGGFLNSRIRKIRAMCQQDESLTWLNQYENIDNIEAHYLTTAQSIANHFPTLDFVFVGAGTTGTLGGISHFFSRNLPHTKIIAVDSVGSITFGGVSGKRKIPGLGASKEPPISRLSSFHDIIRVEEQKTLAMCHAFARKGMLIGGSTGTVLSGVQQYSDQIPKGSTVVAISPDLGERYLNTIYSPQWLNEHFPDETFKPNQPLHTIIKGI
ncbi:N-(2-amino-2-carboxyethyl)-L-glutamate synthase [Pseudoalteromonas holothuriae]|uniref:cysteine synthase n=1 Tax=Pseudoalteromonas holothuriae TaxID=2963714 RepID=A0A9W4VU81_9GAMM|nr:MULTISPECIES: 2,3-diaminopropionate biosynthesis protein SbnA [unclassified Pseudoalteromonas]CAH9063869.1 N-(2-amino-2-carboxyethyl)-L-glutamate synthase [Pseudoalteromonas sp. CIP111854]CAH9064569.1 N-(2-amino-2-carboxyethyl)-L-glutamate synthase [Pseudoalteromonas sp. CIP111951]